jgi:hypothetical protein
MAAALDPDPQVDYLGHLMLDLGRYVKSQGLDGRFAIEFSAHHGDIRSARSQREQPLPQPPAAKP